MREPLPPRYAAAVEPAPNGRVKAATPGTEPAPRAAPPPRFQTFSSLRYRDFRFLWVGTLFMSAGQLVQQATLGWLVYDLTGSSVLLGVLQAVRAMPFLVVSPVAGVMVDRFDRRKMLMLLQVILTVTAMGMGVVVGSGAAQALMVFVFGIITAASWAIMQPLRQTLVSKVVPRRGLPSCVSTTPPFKPAAPMPRGSSNENVAENPLPYCAV